MQSTDDELLVLWPRHAVPGAIAVVGTAAQAERLRDIERAMSRSVFVVRVVISDHVLLGGSLAEAIAEPVRSSVKLNQTPLTIYLHHGSNAVFFDLLGSENQELSAFEVEVEATYPISAFQAARTEANQLLDTLMRGRWLPLVIARLELFDSERQLLGYQLQLPFSSELVIGPLGGIHQYPIFSELEGLAREAICATSPFYRLLCAHRLFDGTKKLRAWLRKTGNDMEVAAPLPKEIAVDLDLLAALGFSSEFCTGIHTANDLYGRLTDMRNRVAHFLLTKGEPQAPLDVSHGGTYVDFSAAAAAMLHYSVQTLQALSSYFRQHLGSKLAQGTILPMIEQRSRFRVVVADEAKS